MKDEYNCRSFVFSFDWDMSFYEQVCVVNAGISLPNHLPRLANVGSLYHFQNPHMSL